MQVRVLAALSSDRAAFGLRFVYTLLEEVVRVVLANDDVYNRFSTKECLIDRASLPNLTQTS